MIRSRKYLETRLRLERTRRHHRHNAIERVEPGSDAADEERRANRRITDLERELASIGGGLDFVLDGQGVHGNSIELGRLVRLVGPVGGALRNTSRDVLAMDGDKVEPQDRAALIEPVLSTVFGGSFGIRIGPAPARENLSLLHDPLFDRTAEKFVSVLRTARDSDDPQPVIEQLWDLRTRSIQSYKRLADELSDGATTAQVRWRGEVVSLRPRDAELMVEAVTNVDETEDVRTVVGTLTGGDVTDQRFHLIAPDPETGRLLDYRGTVADELLPTVRLITLDSRVRAEVAHIITESPLMDTQRVTYELRGLRILDDDA